MFGYKLIKESELLGHEILKDAYKILNSDYCESRAMIGNYAAENAELQATVCEYAEALEAITAERNMWFDTHEKAIELLNECQEEVLYHTAENP